MRERAELLFVLVSGLIIGTAIILLGVRFQLRNPLGLGWDFPNGLGWDFVWLGLGFNAFVLAVWLCSRNRAK